MSFKDLGLNDWILSQCETLGLTNPSPIQENCIPAIISGRDCIGCAKTGSGKTLAFALPILQKLCEDIHGIFCLVLTPTRELAFQIAEQFRVFGKRIGLKDCVIVGGMNMVMQGQELANRPHIVIATPGRLSDHIKSCNTFSLKRLKFLVLDEADRLLEGHFNDQLKTIFAELPEKRQTLLFSATITPVLEELKKIAMDHPFCWSEPAGITTVETLDQRYVLCPIHVKEAYLVHVVHNFLNEYSNGSAVIFVGSCRSCQVISTAFRTLGFNNAGLHSMLKQKQRFAALSLFKSSKVRLLVATDVASRGLDIPSVELVINYNVPTVPKDYIHRVGRTARAGRGGQAISIITPRDINLLKAIEETTKQKLVLHQTKEKEVLKILTQVSVAMREAEIRFDEMEVNETQAINKRKQLILDGKDPDKIDKKKKKLKKAKKLKE